MTINPLFNHFKNTVTQPLCKQISYSIKSVSQKVASVAISGVGNFPFYGVASSFGKRYSSFLGPILGVSEYTSYFCFRIRNFQELFQSLFSKNLEEATESQNIPRLGSDREALLPATTLRSEEAPQQKSPSRDWKTVAKAITKDIAAAAMGLIGQFPFLVLVYHGNGKKLIYPIITMLSEGSFTILSMLKSFKTSPKITADEDLENKRKMLLDQIDRFLEELPSKYNDPEFVKKISSLLPNENPSQTKNEQAKTEEERAQILLNLVLEAKGLPKIQKGPYDKPLGNFAKSLGLLISLYVTTVNAVVSYKGVKEWKSDEEDLAISAAVAVSLFNFKFLAELCINSAFNYYRALRDMAKGQYRTPLAHTVSPIAWYFGRAISTAFSWLSFGTTATGARDYFPKKAGEALIGPAPISSAFILTDNLHWTADDLILWAKSRSDSKVRLFTHLTKSLRFFKNKVENAHPEILRSFLEQLPNLKKQPRPRRSPNPTTPLLELESNT